MAWLVLAGLVLLAVSCNAITLKAIHEAIHKTHGQDGHDHTVHLCSAYFNIMKGSMNGTETDVICDHRDAKNFIVCTLSMKNGTFTADIERCVEGVFDGVRKICSSKMPMPCPSWVNMWHDRISKNEKTLGKTDLEAPAAAAMTMPPTPPSDSVLSHLNEGQHGCIDCKLDKCHKCICDHERKTSWKEMAFRPEPYSHGERYLVCYNNRITCHPCPTGLVWDCEHETCSKTSNCPDIPEACWCDCGRSKPKKTITTVTTATITTVTTTKVTVTSTTSTIHPSGAVIPTGSNTLVKKYRTTTESVCVTTDVASGKESEMPCQDVKKPISTTAFDTKTSTQTKSVTSPTSNTTTITTEDNCSGTTTSTTTKSCPDACPTMTTTIAVGPCMSDDVVPAHAKPAAKSPTRPPVVTLPPATSGAVCAITPLQVCLCEKALQGLPAGEVYICDPHSDDRFLVCQRDQRVFCESCASGRKWNYVKGACDLKRQCKPIPQSCRHLLR